MSAFKDFVYRKFQNHEARIANVEKRPVLDVFVDHEDGQVYSLAFGVTLPVMREVVNGCGGGSAVSIMMGRGGFGIMMGSAGGGGGSAPKTGLQQVGSWTFHKTRVPKCDYVMRNADGTFRFFKKAEVPADVEVNASGKAIKVKAAKK